MFIKDNKRINIYAPFTAPNGKVYDNLTDPALRAQFGVTEIPDPQPPADYSDDTYYRTEQDEAPYTIFTKKSDEQIAAIWWEKVKAMRDNLITNGGAKVADKWYHSDTHSKVQQLSLMIAGASLPQGIQWKTMDGTFVEMTPALAQQIYAAQMAQEQAIFQIAEAAKLTPFQTINWPEIYTEPVVEPEVQP